MNDEVNRLKFEQGCELHELGQYSAAYSIFVELAQAGSGEAMSRLALMYFYGQGVERDIDQSIKWDLAAIERGDLTAIGNVALSYCEQRDYRTARYWFEQAVEKGDGDSALELARLLLVSDAENAQVKRLLDFAIQSDSITPFSRELALQLMKSIEPK